MASPTQAQQPLRACSDTTSKRRQSPQASNYPRDVGRLGAEPPYDGGATTACEARRPLRNLRWQHPYDLQSHQARNTHQVAAILQFAKRKAIAGPSLIANRGASAIPCPKQPQIHRKSGIRRHPCVMLIYHRRSLPSSARLSSFNLPHPIIQTVHN